MKIKVFIATCCLLLSGQVFADDKALLKAIEGKHRAAENVARDQYRNPFKTLKLFDIQPQHTVVEVWPGGGWYTEILAPYLKKDGKLIAAHFDADDNQAGYRPGARAAFDKKMASNKKVYGKVDVVSLMFDESNHTLKMPAAKANSVDRVVTFRSAHGMVSRGILEVGLQHFYDILKPGGKLGFVQHQADLGQDWMSKNIGYVGKQYVIDVAAKAGFVLEAEGYFNNNPLDNKRYGHGVWQLPPTLKEANTDEKKAFYQKIGESDRMTLVFVKPN